MDRWGRLRLVLLAVTSLGVLLLGGMTWSKNDSEPNYCKMTYMFSNPQYIRVPMSPGNGKYQLYYYSERVSTLPKKFGGVPVVFVPGNAGSHKQVRSLASVSLQMQRTHSHHFDYFAIDFDEELAGVHGGVLWGQVEFLRQSLDHVLALYNRNPDPNDKENGERPSVVLVGHSMGGVVIKGMLGTEGFDWSRITSIVTMATPHRPVAVLDGYMAEFYALADSSWEKIWGSKEKPPVTVVALGGGGRDEMVRGDLTCLPRHSDEFRGLSASTVAIPNVWVSADHRAVVWCKQVVIAVCRAFYEILDPTTGQPITNVEKRSAAIRKWLDPHPDHAPSSQWDGRTAPKMVNGASPLVEYQVKVGQTAAWLFTDEDGALGSNHTLSVISTEDISVLWCRMDPTNPTKCDPSTLQPGTMHQSSLPYKLHEFKGVQVHPDESDSNGKRPIRTMIAQKPPEASSNDHWAFLLVLNGNGSQTLPRETTAKPGFVLASINPPTQNVWAVAPSWPFGAADRTLQAGAHGALFEVELGGLNDCVYGMALTATVSGCKARGILAAHTQDGQAVTTYGQDASVTVSASRCARSAQPLSNQIGPYTVQIWASPDCDLHVHVQHDHPSSSMRVLRFYGLLALPLATATTVVVVSHQFSRWLAGRRCPSFWSTLDLLACWSPIISISIWAVTAGYLVSVRSVAPTPPPLSVCVYLNLLSLFVAGCVHALTLLLVPVCGVVFAPLRWVAGRLLCTEDSRALGLLTSAAVTSLLLLSALTCGGVSLLLSLLLLLSAACTAGRGANASPAESITIKGLATIHAWIALLSAPELAVWGKNLRYDWRVSIQSPWSTWVPMATVVEATVAACTVTSAVLVAMVGCGSPSSRRVSDGHFGWPKIIVLVSLVTVPSLVFAGFEYGAYTLNPLLGVCVLFLSLQSRVTTTSRMTLVAGVVSWVLFVVVRVYVL